MFISLYSEARAVQSVAFLLDKAGGSLEILKLMKLVYLAERLSYEKYGDPLIGDIPYSLEHGPILSKVYDRTKESEPPGMWGEFLLPKDDNDIRLKSIDDLSTLLTELSDADLSVLDEVWAKFGHKSSSQLRTYAHTLPEYTDPELLGKRQLHIKPMRLLEAVGFSEREAKERFRDLQEYARAEDAFGD